MPEYFICFVLLFIGGDQTRGLAHPTLNTLGFSENGFHSIALASLTLVILLPLTACTIILDRMVSELNV